MTVALGLNPLQQGQDGDLAFLLALAASFLAALTLAFFFLYLRQEHRRRRSQQYAADLTNSGNVGTPFDIRLEEPTQLLGFDFYHERQRLEEKLTTEPVPLAAKGKGAARPEVIGVARQAGSFGSTIAAMLPQPLAKPLQSVLKGLSQSVMAATRADGAVKAGQKMTKKAGAFIPAGDKTAAAAPVQAPPAVETRVIDRWYETPAVPPGATLELTILVDWQKGLPGHRYPFRIVSQASRQPESLRLTTSGVASLPPEPWWVRALPVLFALSAAAAAAIFVLMIAVTVAILI